MYYSRGTFKANRTQTEAISHPLAPLMILAGAGTGKTTTLLHRIIYLIEHYDIDPKNVLAITYTEKAAEELQSRIIKEIGIQAEKITIGTFHSFCYSIVKDNSINQDDQPILMEEGDAIFMLINRFDDLGPFESTEFALDPEKAVMNSFVPFFNRIRDELIDLNQVCIPEEFATEAGTESFAQLKDLKRIYPIFQRWKQKKNMVDFGDMIFKCYEVMIKNEQLLNSLRTKYQHIIIDEFQDNNFALNEVIGLIAEVHGRITVVGDEDQVIYSFRGANAYNINDFKRRYGHFDQFRQISLEENFRSHQQILDVANSVIKNNSEREDKNLSAENNKTGSLPELWYGEKPAQLTFLSSKIKDLVNSTKYSYGDIAILCRTRNQVREISDHLQQIHIPTQTFLIEYFEIPAIREAIAWCEVVGQGKHVNSAFYRLLSVKINTAVAYRWYRRYQKREVSQRIDLIANDPDVKSDPDGRLILALIDMIQSLRADAVKKSAGEIVWDIYKKTGLLRPLLKRYEYNDQVALMNLGDFLRRAQAFSMRHPDNPSLTAFVRYIGTLQKSGRIVAQLPPPFRMQPAVLVQTIHSVKGGEFPVVFIPNNRSQSFPLNYRPSPLLDKPLDPWLTYNQETTLTPREHHQQEERRLFYVAITRTKEHLFLLAPKKYTSPFIKEIPIKYLEVATMETLPQQTEISSLSQIHQFYEQRLINALARDQFDIVRDLTNVIERLKAHEKGMTIHWGNAPWEIELQKMLSDQTDREPPDKLQLSASAIETYDQCPLKYRLGYIDKIPETVSKPQLAFGSIIHRVLEQYHRESKPQSEGSLLELLDQNWKAREFDYISREQKFKEQGVEILQWYFRHIQENPPHILEREYRFSFDLEEINIRGIIDRIDQGKSGVIVLDYKTSKKVSNPKTNIQLAVYSLFLARNTELEFGGPPELAILFFLREKDDPIKSYTFTTEELEQLCEKIRAVGKGIRNQEFLPATGYHCEWCDYKYLLCPAWEGN